MNIIEILGNLKITFSDFRLLKYIQQDMEMLGKINTIRETFQYRHGTEIVLFDSLKELAQSVGEELPDWVVGTNDHRCILMLNYDLWKESNDSSFSQILVHEFVHVVVNEKTLYQRPSWLNEGLALYLAGQTGDFGRGTYIEKIRSLYHMEYDDDDFYELSGYMTGKLIEAYGIEKIAAKINHKTDFINDDIFGEKNIMEMVKNILKWREVQHERLFSETCIFGGLK